MARGHFRHFRFTAYAALENGTLENQSGIAPIQATSFIALVKSLKRHFADHPQLAAVMVFDSSGDHKESAVIWRKSFEW